MISGNVLELNIRSGEKLEAADVEERSMTFIYQEGDQYVCMHPISGEQVYIPGDAVGDDAGFLQDGAEVLVVIYKGQPMSMTLPAHIVVQVSSTEPAVKGDTANNVTKAATISTGATIQVPLFVGEGDWIKVDTRTRAYSERAKAPS